MIAVIITLLFIFNVIGGKKQTKALEKSIAVLPFINDSKDEENTYFINGIMDEILSNLQKIKDLSVVSLTSVEQFRDQDGPAIPEIARKLDVNYIVEGSGQKYGNIIRLRIQLIDGTKDKHLWADSYEKEIKNPEDIFNIQSQIAQAYAGLAMVYWDKHYQDNYFAANFLDSVLILSDIAVSHDDQVAEAYSLKGDYYREKGEYKKASEEYEKALKINPNYWQAYEGLGRMYAVYSRNTTKAFENINMALKLNHDPDLLPSLLGTVGFYYDACGFFDEGSYYDTEKLKLDGDSADYLSRMASLESRHNNFQKSIEFLKHSYTLDTNNFDCLYDLGFFYDLIGQQQTSLSYFKKYLTKCEEAGIPWINYVHRVGFSYWKNGFIKEGEFYLNLQKKYCEDAIQLNRQYEQFGHAYFDLAGVNAFLGEKEKAYENLNQYLKLIGDYENFVMLWYFKNDPLYESIRNEPRFQSILREFRSKRKKDT